MKERSRELFLRDELLGRQVFPSAPPAKFQFTDSEFVPLKMYDFGHS